MTDQMTNHPATWHVSLPRSEALTDVMLAPLGDRIDGRELAEARQHVLRGMTEAFRSARARHAFRIDAYRLQLALATPDRLSLASRPFKPSPASSKRAIGIEAVSRCVRDPALPPARAVQDVLASVSGSPGDAPKGAWWEEWFLSLGDGAKAVVQSEATTWATQLYTALDWSRFELPPQLGRDYRFDCTRSPRITLHAKVDVRVTTEGRPVLLVVPTGFPGPYWSAALALSALVGGLVRGPDAVPARVVGMWPASGQVRILSVEPGALDRASKLVVEAAWALSRAPITADGIGPPG